MFFHSENVRILSRANGNVSEKRKYERKDVEVNNRHFFLPAGTKDNLVSPEAGLRTDQGHVDEYFRV